MNEFIIIVTITMVLAVLGFVFSLWSVTQSAKHREEHQSVIHYICAFCGEKHNYLDIDPNKCMDSTPSIAKHKTNTLTVEPSRKNTTTDVCRVNIKSVKEKEL